jgi:hypothetical protein
MPLPDMAQHVNKYFEVRVHKSYLTRRNKAFKQRLFYGNDQYTSDSDIVCILHHSSHYLLSEEYDLDETKAKFEALAVVFKVLKARNVYPSAPRNGIKSRRINGFDGHSIKIESVTRLDWIGSNEELLLAALKMPTAVSRPGSRRISK